MSLANLTTSGWVLFALMLTSWIAFVADLVTGRKQSPNEWDMRALTVGVMTAWLLWLVTP